MDEFLTKQVDRALKLFKAYNKSYNISLGYSGGKDSDVILRLAKLAQVQVSPYYSNTTIDPPGTISHVQKAGVFIIQPEQTFFQLLQAKGLPTMYKRFCCSELKERYIGNCLALGVRKAESIRRAKRLQEPSSCRIYSKKRRTEQFFPIMDWSNDVLAAFIEQENIKLHPLYYQNGAFDVTKRLGCLGCPLQGDRGKADFLQYPKLLRAWVRNLLVYAKEHRGEDDMFLQIIHHLFYSNHGHQKYLQNFFGLFPAQNPKEILSNYFKVDLSNL